MFLRFDGGIALIRSSGDEHTASSEQSLVSGVFRLKTRRSSQPTAALFNFLIQSAFSRTCQHREARECSGCAPPRVMDDRSLRREWASSTPGVGRPGVSSPSHRGRQSHDRVLGENQRTETDTKTLRCLGCAESITGAYLTAPGTRKGAYHKQCLRCEICQVPTDRFIVVAGDTNEAQSRSHRSNPSKTEELLVCIQCHADRFAERCGKCHLPLRAPTLSALNNIFHENCFRCDLCNVSIATKTFIPMKDKPNCAACSSCHENKLAPKCFECGKGVIGDHVVALGGNKFHNNCFVCARCRVSLQGTKHIPVEDPQDCCKQSAYCANCHVDAFAERCACGCSKGISGEVVVALGGRWIKGHFRCVECRGDFPNGDFLKVEVEVGKGVGGVALSSPTRDRRDSRRDTGGRDNNVTKIVTSVTKTRAVCQNCYASNHAERCCSCSTPLVGCKFVRVDAGGGAGEKGQAMCLPCEQRPGSLCDDCGRCVTPKLARTTNRTARRESGGVAMIGQCHECLSTAVVDDTEAQTLLRRVHDVLGGIGAREAPKCILDTTVTLVDADRLALAANKRHRGPSADGPRGVTRTQCELQGQAPSDKWIEIVDGWRLDREVKENEAYGQTVGEQTAGVLPPKHSPGTVKRIANAALQHPGVTVQEMRYIKDVLLLRGMSRNALGATLAHEYGHCYLFSRRFPALSLKTEEGICELFSWLWLGGGLTVSASTQITPNKSNEQENARRRHRMETRKDPVYGDGFREAKSALEKCGGNLWRLLEAVRVSGELPGSAL